MTDLWRQVEQALLFSTRNLGRLGNARKVGDEDAWKVPNDALEALEALKEQADRLREEADIACDERDSAVERATKAEAVLRAVAEWSLPSFNPENPQTEGEQIVLFVAENLTDAECRAKYHPYHDCAHEEPSESPCGVTDHDGRVCTVRSVQPHVHDWQAAHEEEVRPVVHPSVTEGRLGGRRCDCKGEFHVCSPPFTEEPSEIEELIYPPTGEVVGMLTEESNND